VADTVVVVSVVFLDLQLVVVAEFWQTVKERNIILNKA
jgi:hypothetical protein